MRSWLAVCITVAMFACSAASSAQSDYSQLFDSLGKRIEKAMKAENVPGAAVAVVAGDRVVWAHGFGVTDVVSPQPVTDTTLFSVQSISKTYTTLAFLRARRRWGIGLDDRLVRVLPSFTMKGRWGTGESRKITFRQLLSHWGGLPHEAPLGNNYDERYCTFDQHISSLSQSWMKARAGSRFSYSNVGVDLVGYALERIAKEPFDSMMKHDILDRLGMRNTTFSFDEVSDSKALARGHIDGKVVPMMRIPMQPSGGMYSTAADLARFIVYALNAHDPDLDRMSRIEQPLPYQTAGYGLGLEIGRLNGSLLLQHGGSGYGYSTMQAWVPAHGIGVVVLANAGDVGFSDHLAHDILREMMTNRTSAAARSSKPSRRNTDGSINAPLTRFIGNYKTYGQVVSIIAEGSRLLLKRGDTTISLKSIAKNVFASDDGERLTFTLGTDGRAVSALVVGEHGVDTWFVNDGPDEPKGTFQQGWNAYIGSYRIGAYGNEFTTTISERNGYLFSSRNGGTKLIPYGKGLFFTPDGESVIFEPGKMSFGNRPAIKIIEEVRPKACTDFPGVEWASWNSPRELGWSAEKLEKARQYAESIGSAAAMIVVDGKVLFQWGETERKFNVHSIRKSFLSALYGPSVDKGEIQLSSTLADLGIDDNPPSLSPAEKQATVQDLLEASSGVFHPAAYETSDMIAAKPKRGSYRHGTYWLYSNWDFNALGTIYEHVTTSTIFREFKHRIAEPLQMQDYQPSDGEYVDSKDSVHPAYPFRMTARDMARFGLLYLRKGNWCGRQVVSPGWIRDSTTAHHITNYKPGVGYGYLWWVGADGALFPGITVREKAFFAWGTGGHYIVVMPESKLVIVNRVNTDVDGPRIDDKQFGQVLRMILDARP